MEKEPGLVPIGIAASLIVFSILLVVITHRQSDERAARATPTPTSVATITPTKVTSVTIVVTVTPSS
jgi:hypothetical protein